MRSSIVLVCMAITAAAGLAAPLAPSLGIPGVTTQSVMEAAYPLLALIYAWSAFRLWCGALAMRPSKVGEIRRLARVLLANLKAAANSPVPALAASMLAVVALLVAGSHLANSGHERGAVLSFAASLAGASIVGLWTLHRHIGRVARHRGA